MNNSLIWIAGIEVVLLQKFCKNWKFLSEAKLINQSIMASPSVASLNDWKMSGATNNAGAGRKGGRGMSD